MGPCIVRIFLYIRQDATLHSLFYLETALHVTDIYIYTHTGCPTRYRTRHFFNNSNTSEDIATKFEQQYVRCRHISYAMR